MPWLNHLLGKNPVAVLRIGAISFSGARKCIAASLAGRLDRTDGHHQQTNADFLDRFLEIQSSHPRGTISDGQICTWLSINVIAGTETTAITLRAAVYFLAINRIAQKNLHSELSEFEEAFRWKTCHKLPYLDAVVKETLRLHPAIGLSLERVVPEGGVLLPDNRYVPEGTVIGMNPCVLQQDESTFGDSPTEFRPERWLQAPAESYEAYQSRLSKMKISQLAFGYGKRRCLGRSMALLIVHKTIAALLTRFEVNAEQPWMITNHWFMKQRNVGVYLKTRQKGTSD